MTLKEILDTALKAFDEDEEIPHGPIETLVYLSHEGLISEIMHEEMEEACGDSYDFEHDFDVAIDSARRIRIKKCKEFATRCKLDTSMIEEFVEDEELCPIEDAKRVHDSWAHHFRYG
tara:strand:- start:3 stop:356 length:354 start_codon:yes stop_codon:yes gene_type:complete